MLCSQVQVLLVAVCSSMLLVHVSAAAQMNELTDTLQADLVSNKVSSVTKRSILIGLILAV